MQEKKLLRDALENFVTTFAKYLSLPPYQDGPAQAGTTHMLICHREAKEALASTTDETEMEKLVAWLKGKQHDEMWKKRDTLFARGRINALREILDYITTNSERRKGMLTEEIEEIICKALGMEVWSSTQKRAVLQVRGDWGQGAKDAAAAIATRLSEGVVWTATALGQKEGTAVTLNFSDFEKKLYGGIDCYDDKLKEQLDGQLVSVTVKIVEGAKDESQRD